MKHIVVVSKCVPKKAAVWQEIACQFTHLTFGLVTTKGGSAPMMEWVDGKCNLPQPNANTPSGA